MVFTLKYHRNYDLFEISKLKGPYMYINLLVMKDHHQTGLNFIVIHMLSIVSAEISIKIMIIQDIIHISFKYNSSITYHFYLYVKETTSMFKDFAMQFSLPISAISILDKKKYNRDKICHCLQGHVPPSISFKCDYINLRWLEANFVNLQMMQCSSNCYGMFKGFIFISLTRNVVPIYFLPLLEDFDLI
jgi:hypothetical protein